MPFALLHSARQKLNRLFGPSTLITAAFIGPGTVTVCTLAGVNSGYTLLWALLFSMLATVVLQEMSARLGLVTGRGFAEAMREQIKHPLLRVMSMALVLSAIVIGNAAYEGGNIAGAALGLEELLFAATIDLGQLQISLAPLVIATAAWLILASHSQILIQRFLLALVAVMSLVFISTAVLARPDWSEILTGLLLPRADTGELLTVVALIGTTVVPYNLFLHAALVSQTYRYQHQLAQLRLETVTAVLIGGLISISIVITSAATLYGASNIASAADMARQLQPLLGSWANLFLATGLFAAGISSAITAPLAAAYAARGILAWDDDLRSARMRRVWQAILLIGTLAASFGFSPVLIIQFAQVTNGILLPVIAAFLLLLMNRTALLGDLVNNRWQNLLGVMIVFVTLLITWRSLNSVFGFF
jgi:NRAMP (natural resistance-associated macrophage protein)-like metal ion transporter